MTRSRMIALAGCSAVLLGACGGEDTLSAADYRKEVTAICTDSNKKTDALKQPEKPEDFKPFLEKGLDITEEQRDKLKEISPPEDLKSKHDEVVKVLDDGIKTLNDVKGKLGGGSAEEITKAITPVQQQLDSIDKRGDQLAKDLGVPKCAES